MTEEELEHIARNPTPSEVRRLLAHYRAVRAAAQQCADECGHGEECSYLNDENGQCDCWLADVRAALG